MGLAALESLLQASIGLSAASIGPAAIARAVEQRLAACDLSDPLAYLERVRASGIEMQALIEAVVVPETWFFRDRHSFTVLARVACEEWLPAHPEGVLSLLSLPCSTGEEPYSMTMALLDASVPANRFRVDAVDISLGSLAQAANAIYGKNSFRGLELTFREIHFDEQPEGYRVKENVRRQVHFQQGNLLASDFLPGMAAYDVIFCRNVLIYFDRPTQDRAIAVLNRLLRADGLLFVAPAETSLPSSHDLVSTHEPRAFAFRKAGMGPSAPARKPAPRVKPALSGHAVAPAAAARRAAPAPAAARTTVAGVPAARSVDPSVDLDQAMRLADQGHFAEAAAGCEAHLRRFGPSARAFYLMGLVRDATGNHADAAANYRKALYLDPNHYDTQIHLALLMENQGDLAAARVLRDRARRLEQKGQASHG